MKNARWNPLAKMKQSPTFFPSCCCSWYENAKRKYNMEKKTTSHQSLCIKSTWIMRSYIEIRSFFSDILSALLLKLEVFKYRKSKYQLELLKRVDANVHFLMCCFFFYLRICLIQWHTCRVSYLWVWAEAFCWIEHSANNHKTEKKNKLMLQNFLDNVIINRHTHKQAKNKTNSNSLLSCDGVTCNKWTLTIFHERHQLHHWDGKTENVICFECVPFPWWDDDSRAYEWVWKKKKQWKWENTFRSLVRRNASWHTKKKVKTFIGEFFIRSKMDYMNVKVEKS